VNHCFEIIHKPYKIILIDGKWSEDSSLLVSSYWCFSRPVCLHLHYPWTTLNTEILSCSEHFVIVCHLLWHCEKNLNLCEHSCQNLKFLIV
jgi:hypothetical protein